MKEQTMNNLELKPSQRQQKMKQNLGDPTVDREVVMQFLNDLIEEGYIKLVGGTRNPLKWAETFNEIYLLWDTYRSGQRFGARNK
tara:strand:- start:3087 stop:3341 length:255 start_codon:yes stop_codon:yes gene_type:complete